MKAPNSLLEDLKSILPAIAANAERAERERMVPAENITLLKGIGMHRAFQPHCYGGMEISLPEFADCVVALAGACASTAWAFSLLCTHSHQLAMYSKQLQDEVWGENSDATASSSIAPFGKTLEVEGGGSVQWGNGME
jgi:alkylation response protein AidB-like acyl-CoA dehydrogenase